jgi:AraC-like DNA-binding protein
MIMAMKRVIGAGRKHQPRGYRNDIRGYPQFMVLVVMRGELVVQDGGVRETVVPPGVVVLTPGIDVVLSSPRTGYHGFYVEGARDECDLPSGAHRIRPDAGILQTLADIEHELAHPSPDDETPALYQLLLARCARRCRPRHGRLDSGVLADQVDRLLRANLYRQAPLADILAPLPLGRRQLARIYRAARGTTIKRAQLALKIAEARALLRNPQLSVTAIAFDLGFPSSQHFATAFRAIVGASPRAWREAQPG